MNFTQEPDEILSAWERDRAPVLGVTAALTAADADAPRNMRAAIWIDAKQRKDLIALAEAYGALGGELKAQWGFTLNPDRTVDVLLRFEFSEPIKTDLTVGFNLPDRADDIERILLARGELALVFVLRNSHAALDVSLNAASVNKLADTVAALMSAIRLARAVVGDAPGARSRTPRGGRAAGGGIGEKGVDRCTHILAQLRPRRKPSSPPRSWR